MGGATSVVIPEQIDIESFRSLSGDSFNSELFECLKNENGFITRAILLELNGVNSHLPRFIEALAFFKKCNMSITVTELQELLKEIGLVAKLDDPSSHLSSDRKFSFLDFFKIVSEKINKMDKAVLDTFEMFDVDHNGFVSAQEIKQVMNQLGEAISDEDAVAMVRDADIDGDGLINIEEFQQKVYPAMTGEH